MLELDSFNHEILEAETVRCTVIPIVHIGSLSEYKINIILIILLSSMGAPCPKELNNDLMPHPNSNSKCIYSTHFFFIFLHIHKM